VFSRQQTAPTISTNFTGRTPSHFSSYNIVALVSFRSFLHLILRLCDKSVRLGRRYQSPCRIIVGNSYSLRRASDVSSSPIPIRLAPYSVGETLACSNCRCSSQRIPPTSVTGPPVGLFANTALVPGKRAAGIFLAFCQSDDIIRNSPAIVEVIFLTLGIFCRCPSLPLEHAGDLER